MTRPARIPSDVNRPDKILGPFTARQVAILAAAAGLLYLAWLALRPVIPLLVFLIAATPLGALALLLAVGQRDGLSMDRLLIAAVRHRLTRPGRARSPNLTRRTNREHDPNHGHGGAEVPGWLTALADLEPDATAPHRRTGRKVGGFPARDVTDAATTAGSAESGGVGVVDLGPDGLVVIAAVSTVNLSLRTPTEQDGLVDIFARYLHTLTAPIQILVRAIPLDLTDHLRRLHEQARTLPHPALAAAADAHRTHLARLVTRRSDDELLTRQVLLVLREPTSTTTGPGRARGGERRLLRRLGDATSLLAPLDVTVTPLPARQTIALLTSLTNPDLANLDPTTASRGGDPRPHRPARRRLATEPFDAAPTPTGDRASAGTWSVDADAHDEPERYELEPQTEHPAQHENDEGAGESDGDTDRDNGDQRPGRPDRHPHGHGETHWDDSDTDIADLDDTEDGEAWDGAAWDDDERNGDDEGWGPDQWTEPARSPQRGSGRDRPVRERGGAGRWVR